MFEFNNTTKSNFLRKAAMVMFNKLHLSKNGRFRMSIFAILVLSIQSCIFEQESEPEPKVFTGAELKALVPPLMNLSSNEQIGNRDYILNYYNCYIDSCANYYAQRQSEGWAGYGYYMVNLGSGPLQKHNLQKYFDGRLVTIKIRCSRGFDGEYYSRLVISN